MSMTGTTLVDAMLVDSIGDNETGEDTEGTDAEHFVDTTHSKPIVFIDLDGTLADFTGYADRLKMDGLVDVDERPDCWPGIFSQLKPMPGAVDAIATLAECYELYIASTNPWGNDEGARDKIAWVKRMFGGDGPENPFYKHVVLTHHKELLSGDYLIDDWPAHGATEFKGELIRYGSDDYPDWGAVTDYLLDKVIFDSDEAES